jgi:RNA polymerase sigma-70 factor (TIGR02960 family)
MDEATLLADARAGDGAAFTALVDVHRRDLLTHCYRMLGSVHDAEDVVQESMVRAWTGLGTFDGRGSIRAWLYRIATHRCLSLLEMRSRRELPADLPPGAPLAEAAWLEPFPDRLLGPAAGAEQRAGVELAFVAALQHLSALQRAVFALREVTGFSAAEVAGQLDTNVAAVNSVVLRARASLAERTPAVSQQAMRQTINDLADRYAAAWHAGDVDAIVSLLTDDATYSMPPLAECYRGPDDIASFLAGGPIAYRWRFVRCDANGQVAFATYLWQGDAYVFASVDVLTIANGRIGGVVSFLSGELWRDFELPKQITG